MNGLWPEVPLGDVALKLQDGPFGSNLKSSHYFDDGIRVIRLQNIGAGTFDDTDKAFVSQEHFERLDKHRCLPGDILIATLGDPILRACRQPDWISLAINKADCLQLRCDPSMVFPNYIVRVLNSTLIQRRAALLSHGQTRSRINLGQVRSLPVPLPPVDAQRRIAGVLDRADELRMKRRAAMATLKGIQDATYRQLIHAGDGRWPITSLASLLARPLRNGVSPSSSGGVPSLVLTLSAITGGRFDPTARKMAVFMAAPPPEKRVCSEDLLICRGNGNLALVGRGVFPREDLTDVAFPDTVIAARIERDRVDPAFLEHLWDTPYVRRQIESLARTTNGTYKVNQAMLQSIELPYPPLEMQRRFGRVVQRTDALRDHAIVSAAAMDDLFSALQHRAFAGQL